MFRGGISQKGIFETQKKDNACKQCVTPIHLKNIFTLKRCKVNPYQL